MKNLVLVISIFLLSACQKEESNQFNLDTSFSMSVLDKNNNDLLNPNNNNSFKEENIKILYLIDGEKIEVNKPMLDYPKGFRIFEHENEYRIAIFPNNESILKFPITYIIWNSTERDTIKCEIQGTDKSEICKKIWYNGALTWDSSENKERFFEIKK
ncbi:MAG: hypothetical protein IMY72_00400 [Bacteroidetes bacterium]|nr:hypothetical protein [Bacteroidota bacterium]